MTRVMSVCPCKSGLKLHECCMPFIENIHLSMNSEIALSAPTPESLMRSRYTAYVLQHYDYIVATYVSSKAKTLSAKAMQKESENTHWLNLQVVSSSQSLQSGEVEFIVYYKEKYKESGLFYCMHELSTFIIEDGHWKYETGKMLSKTGKIKPERNKPCLCGSGKKFKRCCC